MEVFNDFFALAAMLFFSFFPIPREIKVLENLGKKNECLWVNLCTAVILPAHPSLSVIRKSLPAGSSTNEVHHIFLVVNADRDSGLAQLNGIAIDRFDLCYRYYV